MSSEFSMYVVPDEWTLRDCMCVGYMSCDLMMSVDEYKEFHKYKNENWQRLYDILITQPCLRTYTCTDGDPDHEIIMRILPLKGRLYRFADKAFELVPELKKFVEEHRGERYICMN